MSTKETRDMVYLQMVLSFIETSTPAKYAELQNTVEQMQTIDPRHAEMYATIGKTLETLRDKLWTGVDVNGEVSWMVKSLSKSQKRTLYGEDREEE